MPDWYIFLWFKLESFHILKTNSRCDSFSINYKRFQGCCYIPVKNSYFNIGLV